MTVGTMLLFVLYVRQFQTPITALSGLRWEALRAALAFQRVFEVLDATRRPTRSAIPEPRPSTSGDLVLDLRDVRFHYADPAKLAIPTLSQDTNVALDTHRWILDHVSLQVRRGELVALVGSSGAGKSTVALLAAGLYLPVEGGVLLHGRPSAEWSEVELARRVALITQDTFILHDSIRANLA
jgi:ABC-type multidrug transport system fused ATPase/permease subunit